MPAKPGGTGSDLLVMYPISYHCGEPECNKEPRLPPSVCDADRPTTAFSFFEMARSRSVLLGLFLASGVLAVGVYWLLDDTETDRLQTSVSVSDAMTGDTTGYRRAETVREFTFPEDHGPHPDYKTEWWYMTGNLEGPQGQPYGYELTIFRFALTPKKGRASRPNPDRSGWRTHQSYMAHFALTDGANQTFESFERFSRGSADLAGAQTQPFRVWLENWSMTSTGEDTFPMRLRADASGTSINLTVEPEKPLILQGDRGLSRKGPGSGNASYYYSYTRLRTNGHLTVNGDSVTVSGLSWLDREWSTSALGPNQVGWDWFSLQLDDGRDVMYYQIRNEDGSASRFSEGVLVGPKGAKQPIHRDDVSIDILDRWTSPDGTHTYPVEWQLQLPEENLTLHVVPVIPNQELDVSVRYWEGAVQVQGSTTGRGYVEMTGYGNSPPSPTS